MTEGKISSSNKSNNCPLILFIYIFMLFTLKKILFFSQFSSYHIPFKINI